MIQLLTLHIWLFIQSVSVPERIGMNTSQNQQLWFIDKILLKLYIYSTIDVGFYRDLPW